MGADRLPAASLGLAVAGYVLLTVQAARHGTGEFPIFSPRDLLWPLPFEVAALWAGVRGWRAAPSGRRTWWVMGPVAAGVYVVVAAALLLVLLLILWAISNVE